MTETEPGLLQAFLSGRDVACPACGYNLRDLQGSRCPECGDELHLQVGLVEPRQAAAIAGLIGLAAGAGMSGLLLGYVLIQVLLHPMPVSIFDHFVLLNAGGLVVEGIAVILWLRNWRLIRRLSASRRTALVLGCWGLSLLNLLIFSIYIR